MHDFHDYAGQYGILPPNRVSISINPKRGSNVVGGSGETQGAAPMVQHMNSVQVSQLVANGILGSDFFLPELNNQLTNLVYPAVSVAHTFVPDMYMGTNETESDVFHTLIFHQLAHGSHFRKAGSDFWVLLAGGEMNNGGWGDDPTVTEAGRIALVEGWAEMIGYLFAHERYGPNFSINENWLLRLEDYRNVYVDYIPVGVHHDMTDAVVDDPLQAWNLHSGGGQTIVDNIDGITLAQLYSLLVQSTEDVGDYKTLIQQNLIDGVNNTQQELIDLFNGFQY